MTHEELECRIENLERLLGYMFFLMDGVGFDIQHVISDYIQAEGIQEGVDGRMMPPFRPNPSIKQ